MTNSARHADQYDELRGSDKLVGASIMDILTASSGVENKRSVLSKWSYGFSVAAEAFSYALTGAAQTFSGNLSLAEFTFDVVHDHGRRCRSELDDDEPDCGQVVGFIHWDSYESKSGRIVMTERRHGSEYHQYIQPKRAFDLQGYIDEGAVRIIVPSVYECMVKPKDLRVALSKTTGYLRDFHEWLISKSSGDWDEQLDCAECLVCNRASGDSVLGKAYYCGSCCGHMHAICAEALHIGVTELMASVGVVLGERAAEIVRAAAAYRHVSDNQRSFCVFCRAVFCM